MVVEDDWFVLGEQRLEAFIAERVWVRAEGAENHKICHVHDTDPQGRDLLAEQCSGGDYFEGHLHTDTYENDIRRHALVSRGELPD